MWGECGTLIWISQSGARLMKKHTVPTWKNLYDNHMKWLKCGMGVVILLYNNFDSFGCLWYIYRRQEKQ